MLIGRKVVFNFENFLFFIMFRVSSLYWGIDGILFILGLKGWFFEDLRELEVGELRLIMEELSRLLEILEAKLSDRLLISELIFEIELF